MDTQLQAAKPTHVQWMDIWLAKGVKKLKRFYVLSDGVEVNGRLEGFEGVALAGARSTYLKYRTISMCLVWLSKMPDDSCERLKSLLPGGDFDREGQIIETWASQQFQKIKRNNFIQQDLPREVSYVSNEDITVQPNDGSGHKLWKWREDLITELVTALVIFGLPPIQQGWVIKVKAGDFRTAAIAVYRDDQGTKVFDPTAGVFGLDKTMPDQEIAEFIAGLVCNWHRFWLGGDFYYMRFRKISGGRMTTLDDDGSESVTPPLSLHLSQDSLFNNDDVI